MGKATLVPGIPAWAVGSGWWDLPQSHRHWRGRFGERKPRDFFGALWSLRVAVS